MNEQAISDEALEREAERIADRIRAAKTELPDGRTGWIGYDSTDGKPSLKARQGLYRGQLGVAVFFGGMYAVGGARSDRDTAAEAVEAICETDPDELLADVGLGIGDGFGSLVYGLSVLADLTDERRYRERAVELTRAISDADLQGDDYDVLLGVAGALSGLLALYERTGESVALRKALTCGDHLLANRYEKWGGYEIWDTLRSDDATSTSTGMGHGVAGIGYALYRLADHADRDEFRDAATDALGFENAFYSHDQNAWKANWTTLPAYPRWWCHGLPGIGLARLGSLRHCEADVLARDVDRARDFDPELADADSLCHGTFSQVAFLLELDRAFEDDYAAQARTLAEQAIERTRRAGGYQVPVGTVDGLCNPALFVGTAGIGYELLRLVRPETLPSICRFE